MDDQCPNCGGPKAIRNPTGSCDHLQWPDNLPLEAKRKVTGMNGSAEAHTEWMSQRIAKLEEVLGWFLVDPRFRVAVGGNPIAVDAMMADARRTLEAKEYPL